LYELAIPFKRDNVRNFLLYHFALCTARYTSL